MHSTSAARRPWSAESALARMLRRTRPRPARSVPRPAPQDQPARRSAGPTRRSRERLRTARPRCRGSGPTLRQARPSMPRVPEWSRCPLPGCLLDVSEEAVDHGRRASVVGEGLPHDTAGEVDRERADLTAQGHEGGLTLGLDLRVSSRGDAIRLAGGGLLGLGDDLLAVLTGGLADLTGLGARLGELAGVLLQRGLGLLLRLVGLGDVSLDRRGTLVE